MKYFILVLVFSCTSQVKKIETPVQLPAEPAKESISVIEYIDNTEQDLIRNKETLKKANEIINGECFKSKMLSLPISWTNNKSKEEVVNVLRGTSEIKIRMYLENTSTIGYMNPGSNILNFNRKFHDKFSACQSASNLAHEVSHIKGFRHPSWRVPGRSNTVPYAINVAIEACCL